MRNRTADPLIKSQLLYRLSYRDRKYDGWGTWIRTREMTESKSVALPLGYAPIKWWRGADSNCRTRRELIYSQPRLATSLPLHHMVPTIGLEPTTY